MRKWENFQIAVEMMDAFLAQAFKMICRYLSSIKHRVSSIKHRVSSIQYPASMQSEGGRTAAFDFGF